MGSMTILGCVKMKTTYPKAWLIELVWSYPISHDCHDKHAWIDDDWWADLWQIDDGMDDDEMSSRWFDDLMMIGCMPSMALINLGRTWMLNWWWWFMMRVILILHDQENEATISGPELMTLSCPNANVQDTNWLTKISSIESFSTYLCGI